MASNRQSSVHDEEHGRVSLPETTAGQQPTPMRPTTLPSTTNAHTRGDYLNIDQLCMSPSPIDTRPRMFQPGTLVDSNTFDRLLSTTHKIVNRTAVAVWHSGSSDDDELETEARQPLHEILNVARAAELQELSQILVAEQPPNDDTAQFILEQLNITLDRSNAIAPPATATTIVRTQQQQQPQQQASASAVILPTQQHRLYPQMNQTGWVDDHDRPYADYGHLDRQTLAQECQFDLQLPTNQQAIRLNAKSFAITAWTDVSKEDVMIRIKEKFDITNIQYICISEEMGAVNEQRHLHVQIIFKEKVDRRKPFLDEVTRTRCNYQVTQNDLAWNEYIKKESNFIEFGQFKSLKARGSKQWPAVSASVASSATTTATSAHPQASVSRTTRTTTVRAQAAERRRQEEEVAIKAMQLAETDIRGAMEFARRAMPTKFFAHSAWYLSTFKYIHLQAQHDAALRGVPVDKEYAWPISFPDCTPRLREAMDRWIQHYFSRTKRAKCLVLIGPTGTGKTSFALSLPGHVNYFHERWTLDEWSDGARYSVYDDIPWDDFEKLNYPSKKSLLTQNGQIGATDKYRPTKKINVLQPAIVLLNPEDAGSLLTEPITRKAEQMKAYWDKRAFIYIMGDDEYFYKAPNSSSSSSGNQSTMASARANRPRLGQPDEFEQMIRRYEQQHR